MTTKSKKAAKPTTEPSASWMKNRVATARKKTNGTEPPAEVNGTPPSENHAPEAVFGTVPDLPHPPAPVTLKEIAADWLDNMRGLGKTKATVSSYEGDLGIATAFFGDGAGVPTAEQIAAFETSDGVMKRRGGRAKAQPTILKTRRALRLALTWAHQAGLITTLPYATAS